MNEFDAKTGMPPETASRGTLQRGIVIEELRLVYVPVSKAACTSLRWLLADLAGIPAERFEDPTRFRVTKEQIIQNVRLWPPEYLVQRSDPGWLDEVAMAEDWLRFTVVRDPARRLWSAWQSKLLLRQPEFVRAFGEEPWFPGVPSSPEEVLESYERFVAALDGDESQRPNNQHWGLQTEILGESMRSLTHVGRVETLDDTLKLLGEHVASFGRDLPRIRRENTTPLPFPGGLLSGETARIIREQYAPDYRAFGYDEPETTSPSEDKTQQWRDRTGILLDSTRAIILRNKRLDTLNRSLQRTSRRVKKVQQNNEVLRQRLARRNEQLEVREKQLEVHEKQLEVYEKQLEVREKQIARLRRELRVLRGSRSWRYTAPLRRLAHAVSRVRRSLYGGGAPSQEPRRGAEGGSR